MTEMEQRMLLVHTEALQTIGEALARMGLALEHLAVEAARYNERQMYALLEVRPDDDQ